MLKEFKEFAIRGNVIDLAVAVIIGSAFGKIIDSLRNPPPLPQRNVHIVSRPSHSKRLAARTARQS